MFYIGKKEDTWFAIDPQSGQKMQTLSHDSATVCPTPKGNSIYIGRTEYTVTMFDSKTGERRWNATFMDYSSHVATDFKDYDYRHFASSSDGTVVTMDHTGG